MDLVQLIIAIIVLIIGWMIISIPLWLAAKVLTGGKATMGEAMLGMLLGGIVFALVYAGTFLLTNIFTSSSVALVVAAIVASWPSLGSTRCCSMSDGSGHSRSPSWRSYSL